MVQNDSADPCFQHSYISPSAPRSFQERFSFAVSLAGSSPVAASCAFSPPRSWIACSDFALLAAEVSAPGGVSMVYQERWGKWSVCTWVGEVGFVAGDGVGDVFFALPEVLHVLADDGSGAGGVHCFVVWGRGVSMFLDRGVGRVWRDVAVVQGKGRVVRGKD